MWCPVCDTDATSQEPCDADSSLTGGHITPRLWLGSWGSPPSRRTPPTSGAEVAEEPIAGSMGHLDLFEHGGCGVSTRSVGNLGLVLRMGRAYSLLPFLVAGEAQQLFKVVAVLRYSVMGSGAFARAHAMCVASM